MKNIFIKVDFLRKSKATNDSHYHISTSNYKAYRYLQYYLSQFLEKINSDNEEDINIIQDNSDNFSESLIDFPEISENLDNLEQNSSIFIKRTNKMMRVSLNDIVRLEAARNYCDIILKGNKRIDVCVPMNEVYEDLNHNCFFRINRSCVINIMYVKDISGNMVNLEDGTSFLISEKYRNNFFSFLTVVGTRKRVKNKYLSSKIIQKNDSLKNEK